MPKKQNITLLVGCQWRFRKVPRATIHRHCLPGIFLNVHRLMHWIDKLEQVGGTHFAHVRLQRSQMSKRDQEKRKKRPQGFRATRKYWTLGCALKLLAARHEHHLTWCSSPPFLWVCVFMYSTVFSKGLDPSLLQNYFHLSSQISREKKKR